MAAVVGLCCRRRRTGMNTPLYGYMKTTNVCHLPLDAGPCQSPEAEPRESHRWSFTEATAGA